MSKVFTKLAFYYSGQHLCTFEIWCVRVIQLCPALCDPMDSTVHGILQARVLDWVAFPCSRSSSQPRD